MTDCLTGYPRTRFIHHINLRLHGEEEVEANVMNVELIFFSTFCAGFRLNFGPESLPM